MEKGGGGVCVSGAGNNPKGYGGEDGPFSHPSLPQRHHLSVPLQARPGFLRWPGSSRSGEVVGPWASQAAPQVSDSRTSAKVRQLLPME